MPASSSRSITAWYTIGAKDDPKKAANAIARGQSVGNPTVYSPLETDALLNRHLPRTKLLSKRLIEVKFPTVNFGKEGVNYLMSVLLGGQCDVGNTLRECKLEAVDLGRLGGTKRFPGPRYGKETFPGPLVGAVIKPKIGLTPEQLAKVVEQLVAGGVQFIKEDEILADQPWCPMKKRIPLVAEILRDREVLYAVCITGDGKEIIKKAKLARDLGANALHLNVWCGLGAYWDLRCQVELPIHFQKSGDRVWTDGPFSISPVALYTLVNAVGCDFAHVGMYGGYLSETKEALDARIGALKNTIPAFSCGLNPDSARQIVNLFGPNVLLNSGGWIAGHPAGITRGAEELVAAVRGIPCASTS